VWPGHPATAHWGFEDPAAVEGSDADKRAAFAHVYGQIAARMQAFVDLPWDTMDGAAMRAAVRAIGEMPV
jgi:arsenate reductase